MSSPLVPIRVAARHVRRSSTTDAQSEVIFRSIPHERAEVLLSDGGIVTAADIIRLLGTRGESLTSAWFCPTCSSTRNNIVLWKGTRQDGSTISGRLALHAGVGLGQVTCWAEILVDDDEPQERTRQAGIGDAERRLRLVAGRARHLIARIREEPTLGTREIIGALVAMVEVCDGDADV